MTPLRRRMIQDMQLRNFAPRTIIVYVNCVVRFARHFGRSPEILGPDDVRAYLLDMIEQRRQSWAYYNLNLQALRFLKLRSWAPRPTCGLPRRGRRNALRRSSERPGCGSAQGPAAATSAIAAQLVAAAEIHWSCPWGKPLSKYGWNGIERLLTYHDPSSSCVDRRNSTPRW